MLKLQSCFVLVFFPMSTWKLSCPKTLHWLPTTLQWHSKSLTWLNTVIWSGSSLCSYPMLFFPLLFFSFLQFLQDAFLLSFLGLSSNLFFRTYSSPFPSLCPSKRLRSNVIMTGKPFLTSQIHILITFWTSLHSLVL